MDKRTNGLIHIYTGDGKGKTTAALGLGLRAYGRGFTVLLVQFLKGQDTGELAVLQQFAPKFTIRRNGGLKKFVKDMDPEELLIAQNATRQLWEEAVAWATQRQNQALLILDEMMAVLSTGLLPLSAVMAFLTQKPSGLEVVLTGRNAPPELVALADYVSEIKAVKHPYEQGIAARKGIEY